MKLSDFDYTLPPGMIAQHPVRRRTDSRMLVVKRGEGEIIDSHFYRLPEFIDSGYFLVLNDSKVFKARLFGRRTTGGKVEIFLVRRTEGTRWLSLLRPSGRIHRGEKIHFGEADSITVLDEPGPLEREVEFPSEREEGRIIEEYGRVPLPPYIKREAENDDVNRYQTVYADRPGSVAAPTAGLHFDREILTSLSERGVEHEKLTLHVGPGTFKPVTAEKIEAHTIDPEYAEVSPKTAEAINERRRDGQKLLAVGTTSIRTLEYLADDDGMISPYTGMVDLFIYPPYRYRAVDAMLTNFHLPKTSLLMLVAAFCGRELLFEAYEHAIAERYRFYSYGDCMLIL